MEDPHSNTEFNAENHHNNQVTSSLASHFGTNYAPTDDELTKIRSLLVAPTARLEELKATMKQMEAEYDVLREQRKQLEVDIAEYRALVSPMRRLPIDLLREVFLRCIPTDHNAILSLDREPMSLTRVCSAWRAVVLSTPALWASLHIAVPAPLSSVEMYGPDLDPEEYKAEAEDMMRMRTRAVQEWLVRSGACRLDISLYDRERSEYEWPNANYEEFLNVITPHSKRWRSMTFTTAAHSLFRVAALNAEDVPVLEEIIINMPAYLRIQYNTPSPPVLNWADKSFLSAPRLHRVTFSNLRENINTLPIHFQQLTHISLKATSEDDNMSLANVSVLLVKCPKLISAGLRIAYKQPPQPAASVGVSPQPICTSPIVLPYLINLSLINSEDDISSFFAMLDVPQLSALEYHTRANAPHADDFIAFLSRVSETLTNLTTDTGMFSRSDFFAMLKAARRLKNLVHKHRSSSSPWGDNSGYSARHFDDIFLGMLVCRRLGQNAAESEQSNWAVGVDVELEKSEVKGAEESFEDYSHILLPELEILDCRPAHFTDDGLVKFLELRQNLPFNSGDTSNSSTFDAENRLDNDNLTYTSYTPLRRFYVHLDRRVTRETLYEDIERFEDAGLVLDLSYSQVTARDPFSPADGIPTSDTSSPFDR